MPTQEHRLGVSEANLVIRHLKLEPCEANTMRAALVEIDQLFGLDGVSFDERSHMLNAAYDATRISIDCVLEVLSKYGIEVGHDWWTHLKEGYYRAVDGNVQDKANREPLSCHPPPPAARKR